LNAVSWGWLGAAVVASIALLVFAQFWVAAGVHGHGGEHLTALRLRGRHWTAFATGVGATVAVGCFASSRWYRVGTGGRSEIGCAVLVCFIFPLVLATRGVQAAYVRVAGTEVRTAGDGRRSLCVGTGAVLYGWPVAVAAVAPWSLATKMAALAVGCLLIGPVLNMLLVPLTVRLYAPGTPSGQLEARLHAIATQAGVTVRGFRISHVPARRSPAGQLGGLGLTYVVVADDLCDQLPGPQFDAVVAHELGHVRRHHTAYRLMIYELMVLAFALALIDGLTSRPGELPEFAAAAGILLSRAALIMSRRNELAADDFAATVYGPDPLAHALRHLADLSGTTEKARTIFNPDIGHPPIGQRIARLQPTAPISPASSVPRLRVITLSGPTLVFVLHECWPHLGW
jgi:Zn-dependent protease with chaperone function